MKQTGFSAAGLMLLLAMGHGLVAACLAQASKAVEPAGSVPKEARAEGGYAAAADYSAKFSGRAVLVMHKGEIVFERYDNGWTELRAHPLASGTKSFSGVLAAIAIKQGLISGWDEVISETVTEWKADAMKKNITLRHLLTLSSGLDPTEDVLGTAGGRNSAIGDTSDRSARGIGSREAKDKFAASITVKSKSEPGKKFEYGPSHFYAFGEFLTRKLKASDKVPESQRTVMAYMQANLFDPIGLKVGRFGKDAVGNPNLPGGCSLTAREWSKFGQLVLKQGVWTKSDGTSAQVVDRALLADCMKPSSANASYGMTWWLLNGDTGASAVADGGGAGGAGGPGALGAAGGSGGARARIRDAMLRAEVGTAPARADGKPWEIYMAAGLGKQRLFVLPQEDMVIVRFAESTPAGRGFDNAEFLRLALGLKQQEEGEKPARRGR